MSKLVEKVGGKPLPPNKNYLIIEICCDRMDVGDDVDDADVDVPYIKYTFDPVCVLSLLSSFFCFFYSILFFFFICLFMFLILSSAGYIDISVIMCQ